jgi:hypothetical protein
MTTEYNLIQFNSHKNIAIKEMWEYKKKRINKNTRCNGVRLKNAYVSGTLNLQQLRLSRYTKNNFTLVELGPLHKNELPSLSVTRVTTHSKRVSDNTLKNKKWVTTHSKTRNEWQHTKKGEHYISKRVSTTAQKGWALQLKKIFTRRSRRIKLGE